MNTNSFPLKKLSDLVLTIQVNPSASDVTVVVNNVGVDTVDRVSVTINSTRMQGDKGTDSKTLVFTNIKPVISQTKTLSIPMVRTEMSYKGTATISDGKKTVYKDVNASLSFSTEELEREWSKGTFNSIRDSIDYHFKKHHGDKYVQVRNLKQYLDKASSARNEMKNITKTTSKYLYRADDNSIKVTELSGKNTLEYVLLTKTSSKKLYSYGGN